MQPPRVKGGRGFGLLLLLAAASSPMAAAASDDCADGIVRYRGGVNGSITLCHVVAQADPQLSHRLDDAVRLLGQQQNEIDRLLKAVNAVGSNVSSAKQIQMLQTLVQKLGNNPSVAPTRAAHLTEGLEGVETSITNLKSSKPAQTAVLKRSLDGSLGDAIAQLDIAEARSDLDDIRSQLNKISAQNERIESTTAKTQTDVQAMLKLMNIPLHPETVLPTKEADLYNEMTPLMTECMQFQTRWLEAESMALRQEMQTHAAAQPPSYGEQINGAWAPIAAAYQRDTLPQLNEWRVKVIARVPNLADTPPFDPLTNQASALEAQQRLRELLGRYVNGDPSPVPELARKGHQLQAALAMVTMQMSRVKRDYDAQMSQRTNAQYEQARSRPRPMLPGQAYVESVDGPIHASLITELEPRLRRWQQGAKIYLPDFKIVDFTQPKTAREFQQNQSAFNGEATRFYNKVVNDLRAATAPPR